MGQMIDVARPDGATTPAYLAEAGPGGPGVVLIQEWWGLNEQIKATADRLALAGFNTLTPDLFRGRLAADANEASHLMAGLDFKDAVQQDIDGAVRWLARTSRAVGVMGFCMGGALAIASAVHVPGLTAAVCFYGVPPAEVADPALIRIPFQGHFATLDDWCTPEVVENLALRMRTAGHTPDIHHYPAQHAFFNQARPEVFDPQSAELAWKRATDFLRQHLAQR